jgi:hypothetical protein
MTAAIPSHRPPAAPGRQPGYLRRLLLTSVHHAGLVPSPVGGKGGVTVVASSLFGQLDRSLHDHLGTLVDTCRRADEDALIELARAELPKMVTALRALLDEHQPDARGRCATCRGHGVRRRRSLAPCRAYLAAHLCLIVAEEAAQHRHQHLKQAS